MDEIEIISKKTNQEKISNLSIEELEVYKLEILKIKNIVDEEIKKRKKKIELAEKIFKK